MDTYNSLRACYLSLLELVGIVFSLGFAAVFILAIGAVLVLAYKLASAGSVIDLLERETVELRETAHSYCVALEEATAEMLRMRETQQIHDILHADEYRERYRAAHNQQSCSCQQHTKSVTVQGETEDVPQ